MIDTHSHYHHRRFNSDRAEVLERIHNAGVAKVIEVPITYESNADVLKLAEKYPWIYPALGIHPNQVVLYEKSEAEALTDGIKKLFSDSRAVALGETGLDYKRVQDEETKASQKEWFTRFVDLSLEITKPLILHVREAARDALDILTSFNRSFSGVVHCFSEDYDVAKRYMDMGFALGVGGSLTYDMSESVRDAVKKAPSDMLLLETDAPFLTPMGREGRNTSLNIPIVVSLMSQLRGETEEEIIRQTTKNAEVNFGI